jgi:ABC-type transporter Mla subunit MlaD
LPWWAVNFNDFRDVGSVDKATSPVRVAGVKVGDLSVLP